MNYLIIGAGAAGMEAAQAIRVNDPSSCVTIVTDDAYTHYFRPKLVHFLSENGGPEELPLHTAQWYQEHGIAFVTGRRITDLGVASHTAIDSQGGAYLWDRALLACGGNAFVPPIPGANRKGVFTLHSLDDAIRIRDYSIGKKRAVVIGGGLLGLENAFALSQRGLDVTVVEFASWLLPKQLDREGGEHLRRLLEAKGLRFILAGQVEAISGVEAEGPANGVRLKSGKTMETDMVLVSIGVRSETSLAVKAGIAVNRGIVVNDRLETSIPGVYAAGDAAEHRGVCYGLWTVAGEQGRAVGANMAGIETLYAGSMSSSQLKITGIDMYSAGDASVFALPEAESETVIKASDAIQYRKLRLGADGKPLVTMVIGEKAAIKIARKIMAGTANPEEFRNL
ncbi:MAG: FAD-dependent oxidoreductase [Treponemataceae bacterium]